VGGFRRPASGSLNPGVEVGVLPGLAGPPGVVPPPGPPPGEGPSPAEATAAAKSARNMYSQWGM
jgi:hypothetical protein